MKKVTSISPFLLVLFPIFSVTIIAFSTQTEEIAKKENIAKTGNSTEICAISTINLK